MKKSFSLYSLCERGLMVSLVLGTLVSNANAQMVTIQGTGGTNLMAYLQWWVSFVWWISLGGCFCSMCFAGFKLSEGDQQGFNRIKFAVIGTLIVAGASGFFKYFIFGSQNAGVSNNNDLF